MVLRYCVYRDCHNSYDTAERKYSKENITFFQFPKNEQRRQKWLQYGKAPENLPASYYFYCSDHFDKKFMSNHNRRTILVGEAVPYVFESMENNEQTEEFQNIEEYEKEQLTAEYYVVEENDPNNSDSGTAVEQQQENEHFHVESTTTIDDDDIIQLVRDSIESEDNTYQVYKNDTATKRKASSPVIPLTSLSSRKYVRTQSSSQSSILVKDEESQKNPLSSSKLKERNKCVTEETFLQKDNREFRAIEDHTVDSMSEDIVPNKEFIEDDNDPESLVDNSNVTVFIFKGEEYVQMPKDYYFTEKLQLKKRLKKMESVIENIKRQLEII